MDGAFERCCVAFLILQHVPYSSELSLFNRDVGWEMFLNPLERGRVRAFGEVTGVMLVHS